MIEPTDEMLAAWRDAMKSAAADAVSAGVRPGQSKEIARAGLAAVLAIIERDYRIESRTARCDDATLCPCHPCDVDLGPHRSRLGAVWP